MLFVVFRGGMTGKDILQFVGKFFDSSFILRVTDIKDFSIEFVVFVLNDLDESFNAVFDIS
jgi:hypothetical protein